MLFFFWNFPHGGLLSVRALFHEVLEEVRLEAEFMPYNEVKKSESAVLKGCPSNKPVGLSYLNLQMMETIDGMLTSQLINFN